MTFDLREYQQEAVDSVFRYYESGGDGSVLVSLPTGSGKSLVQAEFVRATLERWPRTRFLLLSHVKELLDQNAKTLLRQWPWADVGLYSAGLGRKEHGHAITVAGIQSVHRKAGDFGTTDLVIIDECHLCPAKGAGMYRTFLADLKACNPNVKVIGLTATPYRLDSGTLHRGPGALFSDVVYQADINGLVDDGYLSPLVSKLGATRVDTSKIKKRGGEYVPGAAQAAFDTDDIVCAALDEVETLCQDRRKWLIFCSGVDHAHHVQGELMRRGYGAKCITGDTPSDQRDRHLRDFKAGKIRALVNVNVLTTGFDAPDIDAVILLRPTMSPGLYCQMLGRGMRIAEGKSDCLVLDFAGNILMHGPIDKIRVIDKGPREGEVEAAPMKECPNCEALCFISAVECPDCGFVFIVDQGPKHGAFAEVASVMGYKSQVHSHDVSGVRYSVHNKPGKPPSMRVDYLCGLLRFSEWICVQHEGYPRRQAEKWWRARASTPAPDNATGAFLESGTLKTPDQITVETGAKYPRIKGYKFADQSYPGS